MLGFPLFNKSPKNKCLAVDIGSDSIKCLAFYKDGHIAKIIGFGRQHLEPGHVRAGTIVDLESVEITLKEAISEATQNTEEKIDQVIFGLGGSLVINQLTSARLTKNKHSMIKNKELEDIYHKTLKSSEEQANEECTKLSGSSEISLDLITSEKCFLKVDDKLVPNEIEVVTGSKVELGLFTSYAPSYHVKNLNKLARTLGLHIQALVPELYSLTKCLNLIKGKNTDCIIINMGSDKTEIGVVFGGNVITSKVIPVGGTHFSYHMSQKLGLSHKEADNLKKTYAGGKLNQSESLMVQECFNEILDVWLSGVELAFEEFVGVKTFASNIYLTGGSMNLPDAYDFITREPWTKSIPFKTLPVFEKISLKDLPNVQDATQLLSGPEWVMTASLANIFLSMKE